MNTSENKICQNCKGEFQINATDFAFYEKMKVPPPTWCPECRAVRRMCWRNERALYASVCALCKKDIISMYPKGAQFPVYCHECWWSDKWDVMAYPMEYDFSKSFFEQFRELASKIPKCAVFNVNQIGSTYCNICIDLKDCYLLFASWYSENCLYGSTVLESRDVQDALWVQKCENSGHIINCNDCYKTFFAQNCNGCVDSWFIYDCSNCQNCLFSSNLKNKQYYVYNTPVSKDEYEQTVSNFTHSYMAFHEAIEKYAEIRRGAIHKYMIGKSNLQVTGDNIFNSKNVRNSYFAMGVEDISFAIRTVKGQKDSYDLFGVSGGQLMYDSINVDYSAQSKFMLHSMNMTDSYYCADCYSSQNLFGCIGMRNKKYCILNRQYSKDEYEQLFPRIIEHMGEKLYRDAAGRAFGFGEFFPIKISPFAYNESIAQEYYPLSTEEATARGYQWAEPCDKDLRITMQSDKLPETKECVEGLITKEIIECGHKGACNEQCTKAFKITKAEFSFDRMHNLPLPRLCPNCRHYERLAQCNPRQLWHRQCMKEGCANEFETTYAPDRPEIVYCEQCYNAEVV